MCAYVPKTGICCWKIFSAFESWDLEGCTEILIEKQFPGNTVTPSYHVTPIKYATISYIHGRCNLMPTCYRLPCYLNSRIANRKVWNAVKLNIIIYYATSRPVWALDCVAGGRWHILCRIFFPSIWQIPGKHFCIIIKV